MISQNLLENCLHKIGDEHYDVIEIKRFPNFHHAAEVSDIPNGYSFCAKTQTALAQFQQSQGLSDE